MLKTHVGPRRHQEPRPGLRVSSGGGGEVEEFKKLPEKLFLAGYQPLKPTGAGGQTALFEATGERAIFRAAAEEASLACAPPSAEIRTALFFLQ